MYGFQAGDAFTKTECYHYLHSYCLARHLDASKRNHDEEVQKLPTWQQKSAKPFLVYIAVVEFDTELWSINTCFFFRLAALFVVSSSAKMLNRYVMQSNRLNYKMHPISI